MPRRRLPARLKLRKARADRAALWIIVDGEKEAGTGIGADDLEGAQTALQEYLASKHRPPSGESRPAHLLVDEVMATYMGRRLRQSMRRGRAPRRAGVQ